MLTTGRYLSQEHLASSTDTVASAAEENFLSLKRVPTRSSNIITIARTDYSLSSSGKGTPLWNVSISSIKATGSLPLFSLEEVDLPVFFRGEKDNLNWFMYPLASYTGRNEQGSTLVPLLQLNSSRESHFFEHQAKSEQVQNGQNMCLCLDTLGISSKGGNNSLSRTVVDVKGSTSVLPGISSSPLLMIIFAVGTICLCMFLYFHTSLFGGKTKMPIQSDKQVNDVGGQRLVKKGRMCETAKLTNGCPTYCDDTVMSTENRNVESHSDSDMQINDRLPFILTPPGLASYRFKVSSSEIARGSNGTIVFQGNDGVRRVAVKCLLLAHRDLAYKEIENLRSISEDLHPNIVQLYGVKEDANFIYLSLERCDCNLRDLIEQCSGSLSTA